MEKMCDDCGKRPAVYYMKNVINGVTSQRYLCAECKAKLGFTSSPFAGLGNLFSSFGNPFATMYGVNGAKKTCPTCGYTAEEYLGSGYLGCPDCYETFADLITPSLAKMQRDVKHVGKSPAEFYSPEEKQYNELLRKREEAVANEDYRLAGQINEEMKKLKGGA
ncbi:MAG: hypothetical protein IJX05_01045 [Clostridia bacterium]|nr:hypothetical protein [Clostridia bacterium]